MAKTVYSTYTSDGFDVDFVAIYGRFDDIPPDVDVLSLHILGEKVTFHLLPKNLQTAILDLHTETL
jgi:hypothetical protein